jgi:hypothetical protein
MIIYKCDNCGSEHDYKDSLLTIGTLNKDLFIINNLAYSNGNKANFSELHYCSKDCFVDDFFKHEVVNESKAVVKMPSLNISNEDSKIAFMGCFIGDLVKVHFEINKSKTSTSCFTAELIGINIDKQIVYFKNTIRESAAVNEGDFEREFGIISSMHVLTISEIKNYNDNIKSLPKLKDNSYS